MFNKKEMSLLSVVLVILFFLAGTYRCNATLIPNTNIDTYTLSLTGNILNQVSGLNIKIKIKDSKGDIAPGVTFLSNGATVLLSNVTGPFGDDFVITLALNGNIKDGKATIKGKFAENSILPGADFTIVSIERDGGVNITSQITTNISFSNSKAPIETPTTSSSSGAPPSEGTSSSGSSTSTTPPISPEAQNIVNVFLSDNNDIDPDLAGEVLEETLDNSPKSFVKLTGSSKFQLKSLGLNKYYTNLKISVKANGFDRLSCLIHANDLDNINSTTGAGISPTYLKVIGPELTLKLQDGKIYNITKRIKSSFLPVDRGLQILNGEVQSTKAKLFIICAPYSSKDPDIIDYANENDLVVDNLTWQQLFRYVIDTDNELIFADSSIFFNILAPKSATVSP